MLLDLIEHQEELFAAIIAPLNYGCLNALRVTCKALFAAVSGDHRWQHMYNFAASLLQINSIHWAALKDINYNNVITLIYIEKNITCYVLSIPYSGLDVCSTKYNSGDDAFDIDGIIEYYPLESLLISDLINNDAAPKWLLDCIEKIMPEGYYRSTEILDIRP
jgi:hypothetical protein